MGAEIVSRVQEACFDYLKAPVLRVTSRDVAHPYATVLENAVVPSPERIITAIHQVVGK